MLFRFLEPSARLLAADYYYSYSDSIAVAAVAAIAAAVADNDSMWLSPILDKVHVLSVSEKGAKWVYTTTTTETGWKPTKKHMV